MKLTDDIVKALHRCVTEGYESVTEFARLANVSAETVKKYMRRETESIKEETWSKLQPLLKPYMGRKQQKTSGFVLTLSRIFRTTSRSRSCWRWWNLRSSTTARKAAWLPDFPSR